MIRPTINRLMKTLIGSERYNQNRATSLILLKALGARVEELGARSTKKLTFCIYKYKYVSRGNEVEYLGYRLTKHKEQIDQISKDYAPIEVVVIYDREAPKLMT